MLTQITSFAGTLGNIATVVGFICLMIQMFNSLASQVCRVSQT